MRMISIAMALILSGCAELGHVPSLAPRPIERGTPAPAPPESAVAPADPALGPQIATLIADARAGDALFVREDRSGAAAIVAGARAPEGSEAWIAGETARSALEAARQRSSDALAALDQLVVATTAANGGGLAEILRARDEAATIVDRQTERLAVLSR